MNKLKFYRMSKKLTQRQLAEKAGVTHEYISQIERGRIPGMDTAQKIARIFETTIDEIFFTNNQN